MGKHASFLLSLKVILCLLIWFMKPFINLELLVRISLVMHRKVKVRVVIFVESRTASHAMSIVRLFIVFFGDRMRRHTTRWMAVKHSVTWTFSSPFLVIASSLTMKQACSCRCIKCETLASTTPLLLFYDPFFTRLWFLTAALDTLDAALRLFSLDTMVNWGLTVRASWIRAHATISWLIPAWLTSSNTIPAHPWVLSEDEGHA